MFTGLVAELGTVQRLARQGSSYHLTVGAKKVLTNLKIGDSVAVNGACLTVVRMDEGGFTADVMPETCLLYTSPSPRDRTSSRMPSSA